MIGSKSLVATLIFHLTVKIFLLKNDVIITENVMDKLSDAGCNNMKIDLSVEVLIRKCKDLLNISKSN